MRRFSCSVLPQIDESTFTTDIALRNQRTIQTICAVYVAERNGDRRMVRLFEERTGARWDSRSITRCMYMLECLYYCAEPTDERRLAKVREWLTRKNFSPVCVEALDLFVEEKRVQAKSLCQFHA